MSSYQFPRVFSGTRLDPPASYVAAKITNAGAAPDYEGVLFSDGTVVTRWLTEFPSHSVWDDWNSFWHVHGHPEYSTKVRFADGGPPPDLTCVH